MDDRLKLIADHFGLDNQLLKIMEEAGELIQIAAKILTLNTATDESEIIERFNWLAEEMADVEILIAQLRYLLGETLITRIEDTKEFKIERTLKRYKIGRE